MIFTDLMKSWIVEETQAIVFEVAAEPRKCFD